MQRYEAREPQDMGKRSAPIAADEALAVLRAEAARIAAIKARSSKPFGVGSDIVDVAPARGAVERVTPRETIQRGGQTHVRKSGWRGQDALRIADAFDVMEAQAQRRAKIDGKLPKGYRPLFTTGQLGAGRDYAALAERVLASGVKCSSIEAMGAGSGGQGSWIDAVLRDGASLAMIRQRVGNVAVLAPQRTGTKRAVIWAQDLVDRVCISDQTLTDILKSYRWSPKGESRMVVRDGLRAALSRMQGYTRS